jgi:hypothetical protein
MEIAYQFIRAARVFARCSPLHKQTLVTSLALPSPLPSTAAFCGDGVNDCGALKTAHVGLSLSDTESSIAAPFTSSTRSVRAMVDLIREGRAAPVSSGAAFKFMALYSLTQLISVLRLYEVNATLTDEMLLWVDLFLVLPFVVTMAQTAAAPRLTRLRPQGSGSRLHSRAPRACARRLVSPSVLASNAALQIPNTTLPDSSADTMLAQDAMHSVESVAQDSANSSQDSSGLCWNGSPAAAARMPDTCCPPKPKGEMCFGGGYGSIPCLSVSVSGSDCSLQLWCTIPTTVSKETYYSVKRDLLHDSVAWSS